MYSKNTNVSGLWRKTVATVTYLRRKITSITGFWKGPFSRTEMSFLRTDVCSCISSKRSKIGKFSFNEWKTWLCSFVSVILRPKQKQRSENPWNSHLRFNEASMAIDHRPQRANPQVSRLLYMRYSGLSRNLFLFMQTVVCLQRRENQSSK